LRFSLRAEQPGHWPYRCLLQFLGGCAELGTLIEMRSISPRLLCRARALDGEITDLEAATGFNRQYPSWYLIIHLVALVHIELRVLVKRDSTLTPPASTCRVV
jgi:hypothetical protein